LGGPFGSAAYLGAATCLGVASRAASDRGIAVGVFADVDLAAEEGGVEVVDNDYALRLESDQTQPQLIRRSTGEVLGPVGSGALLPGTRMDYLLQELSVLDDAGNVSEIAGEPVSDLRGVTATEGGFAVNVRLKRRDEHDKPIVQVFEALTP
jgi:hypothetical protein